MKKILLMSAFAVASFGAIYAQAATVQTATTATQQLPQVRAKSMLSKLTKVVDLQGDQFTKANNIYIEYFTKLDGLGATPNAAKVKDLDNNLATSINGILTPAQQKLWSANPAK